MRKSTKRKIINEIKAFVVITIVTLAMIFGGLLINDLGRWNHHTYLVETGEIVEEYDGFWDFVLHCPTKY